MLDVKTMALTRYIFYNHWERRVRIFNTSRVRMSKEGEIDDDDAFDDSCVSTMHSRAIRMRMLSSMSDNQTSRKSSYSSLFSLPEIDSIDSQRLHSRRYSSSSSAIGARLGSLSSLNSTGPSSTPGSIHEFVIPRRTIPPRPKTLTSKKEILYQIDSNNVKGYHSVILREMRGKLPPESQLKRPVCGEISSIDFDSHNADDTKSLCDSLRSFEF